MGIKGMWVAHQMMVDLNLEESFKKYVLAIKEIQKEIVNDDESIAFWTAIAFIKHEKEDQYNQRQEQV